MTTRIRIISGTKFNPDDEHHRTPELDSNVPQGEEQQPGWASLPLD